MLSPRSLGRQRQDVARVVEMHDGLQAFDETVVPVRFDEGRIRVLIYIAERRVPEACLVIACKREPARIHARGFGSVGDPSLKNHRRQGR